MKQDGPSRVGRRQSTKAPIRTKVQRMTTQGLMTRARKQVGTGSPAGVIGVLTGRDMGAASTAHGSLRPINQPAKIGRSSMPSAVPIPEGKVRCLDCGGTFRAKKDGQPYSHNCEGA